MLLRPNMKVEVLLQAIWSSAHQTSRKDSVLFCSSTLCWHRCCEDVEGNPEALPFSVQATGVSSMYLHQCASFLTAKLEKDVAAMQSCALAPITEREAARHSDVSISTSCLQQNHQASL